jgi:hypothetical protein
MMTAIRKGIRIIISSPGDLAEERTRFHGIVAEVMAKMPRARKV